MLPIAIARSFRATVFSLVVLFSLTAVPVFAAPPTLANYTYATTATTTSATADYTFTFTTATEVTNASEMIFKGDFGSSFDLSSSTAAVTVGGTPITVGEFWNGGGSGNVYIRLTDTVPAGSNVVVTISNIVNPSSAGYYTIDSVGTGDSGRNTIDAVPYTTTFTIGDPTPIFDGGDGSDGSPFLISTCLQLQGISHDLTATAHYKLTTDVDCSETSSWNGGKGFTPLGDGGHPFMGTFLGNGHIISNLYINDAASAYAGLFGNAYGGAVIRGVQLSGATVIGGTSVGSLVGSMAGVTFEYNSVITATVTASNGAGSAGGLIGYAGEANNIHDSYSQDATINGGTSAGGVIGWLNDGVYSLVSNLYFAGTNLTAGDFAGPIAGSSNNTVSNSFYDHDLYGSDNGVGTAKTTGEMQTESTFTDATWDFEDVWVLNVESYPTLRWTEPVTATYGGGDGSEGSPFQISSCDQLQYMSHDLTAHYILTGDVDCSGITNFKPVGTIDTPFTGGFDGDHHTISNLNINRPLRDTGVGLFGAIQGVAITDLVLNTNINISGHDYVGSLVGNAVNSQITNVTATATVSGHGQVGGLIGAINGGTNVTHSSVLNGTTVSGSSAVGGLIGLEASSTYGVFYVTQSSAAATTVSGDNGNIGGLIGYVSTGGIADSYSQSNISLGGIAVSQVGGLIGGMSHGMLLRTYAAGTVSTNSTNATTAGLVGGAFFRGSITDSFSAVHNSGIGASFVYGLYGSFSLDTGDGFALSNNFYDGSQNDSNACYASGPDSELNCVQINPIDPATYWKQVINSPIAVWDTTTVWNVATSGSNWPELYAEGEHAPTVFAGTGTTNDPYQIGSCGQLQAMNEHLDSHFILLSDINCSETSAWNSGLGFSPVGDQTDRFQGELNGDGHTISGLTINRPAQVDVGLFGYTDGALIKNISLTTATITGLTYVGALAGFIRDTTLNDVSISATVSGESNIGALAGIITESTVEDSNSEGTVTSSASLAGGFAGETACGSEFSRDFSTATVSGETDIGGFTGFDGCEGPGSIFNEVYATGSVTGTNKGIGGLIGHAVQSTVQNAYASGDVHGSDLVGGLVGNGMDGTYAKVYARGHVTGTTGNVGGLFGKLAGQEITISNTDTFFDATIMSNDPGTWGTGKTTAQMNSNGTFITAGWDFEEVWARRDVHNDGYPYFKWQFEETDTTAPVIILTSQPPRNTTTSNVIWAFQTNEACEVIAEPIVASPAYEAELLFEEVQVGTNVHGTLQPVQTGETYTITFSCRDNAGNVSNELTVGPFTVGNGSGPVLITTPIPGYGGVPPLNSSTGTPGLNGGISNTEIFTHDLGFGMTDPDVKRLQEYLNSHNAQIAKSGPGSPGKETTRFGSLTRSALKKFQKAHGITPTTGYFGPKTRKWVNEHWN